MKYDDIVSVVIPTYNSESSLANTLLSIKKQSYPQKNIEIIVVDGGSTDKTTSIAKKFNSKILKNLKTELIYGKHIGYFKSKGKYIIFLDSDEQLSNSKSIESKVKIFKSNLDIKAVLPSGYKTPSNAPKINDYINEFGDPFTYFIYGESKISGNPEKEYKLICKNYSVGQHATTFNFEKKTLPLVEIWAGGCCIDGKYCKKYISSVYSNPSDLAHIFYYLVMQGKAVAVMHQDDTEHFSCTSIFRYLKKINSRVQNNIFETKMGKAGARGREVFLSKKNKYKKFLFIPYSISMLIPLIDGVILATRKKKYIYLLHMPLCVFTAMCILYNLLLKSIMTKKKIKFYGT